MPACVVWLHLDRDLLAQLVHKMAAAMPWPCFPAVPWLSICRLLFASLSFRGFAHSSDCAIPSHFHNVIRAAGKVTAVARDVQLFQPVEFQ